MPCGLQAPLTGPRYHTKYTLVLNCRRGLVDQHRPASGVTCRYRTRKQRASSGITAKAVYHHWYELNVDPGDPMVGDRALAAEYPHTDTL